MSDLIYYYSRTVIFCLTAVLCVWLYTRPALQEAQIDQQKLDLTKSVLQSQTFSLQR